TDILITDIEATISTEQSRISWSSDHNIHIINFVAGTKNPTIIDGRILTGPTLLSEGNQIIMGKNVMVYRRKVPCELRQFSEEQTQTEYSFPAQEEIPPPPIFIEEEIELIETGYMLKVISGLEEGKKFELNRPIISVGKLTIQEKKGWLLLDSSFVSADQATLKWMAKERTYGIVHTKGAANPTFVNNKEISSDEFTMLEQGDILRIGNIKMIVGKIPVHHDGIDGTEVSSVHDHSGEKHIKEDQGDAITLPRRITSGTGGSLSRDIPHTVPGKHMIEEQGDAITLPRRISSARNIPGIPPSASPQVPARNVSDEDEVTREFRNRPRTPQSTNYLDEESISEYVEEHSVKPSPLKGEGIFRPRDGEKERVFSASAGNSDAGKGEERKLSDMMQEPSRLRKGHGTFRPRSHDGVEETIRPDFSRLKKDGEKKLSLPLKSAHYKEDEEDEEDDRTIMDQTMVAAWKDAHKFKVISGPDEGRVFIVSKEMVQGKLIIGSKGKIRKDIELSDDNISDNHGSLSFENNWLCINLEDEHYDILVNDMPVMKKGLENGDLIEIGTTILEYSYLGMENIVRASCEIEILEGPDKGHIFHLRKDKNYIGRKSKKADTAKEIELSEKDRSVSRSHAFIEKKDKEYFLINEKEANVTILNGVQVVEPRPLVDGDKIKLGSETVLLFKQSKVPMVPKEKKVSTEGREKMENTHNTPQALDEDMVFIEGGPFWMGVDHIECDANPMHKVHIESFYIDRYAVTNFQYEDFIRVTGYEPKGNWKEYFTAGKEYYPVTGVSYDDADAYAYWVGKRLPSEAEWEKAARGQEGFLYPWGKKWDSSRTCSEENAKAHTVSVDSFPEGQSPYGVMNMLGNIWEWTGDYYEPYPYKGPYPPDDEDREITIRGGDFNTELKVIGVPVRNKIFPGEFGPTIGFRCARSA
ncbi:MAG: SUMF1/EgtB/PvdO family nonheme iron enzyme, partial [Candidatus Eremiobacterota bacterium]